MCFIEFHYPFSSEFLLIILYRELPLSARRTTAIIVRNATLWPCDQNGRAKLAPLDGRLVTPQNCASLFPRRFFSLMNIFQVGICCLFLLSLSCDILKPLILVHSSCPCYLCQSHCTPNWGLHLFSILAACLQLNFGIKFKFPANWIIFMLPCVQKLHAHQIPGWLSSSLMAEAKRSLLFK